MGRSALPMRRPTCLHGPVRVAAHEMWCTIATTTTATSILPIRRPTCFHRPARVAAHEMWCTTVLHTKVLLQYYYDVRAAHETAHGLSRAETRAGPCTLCTKTSRRAVYYCAEVFPRSEIPGAYMPGKCRKKNVVLRATGVVFWIG